MTTELGRVTAVLDVDDSKLLAGFAKATLKPRSLIKLAERLGNLF